MNQARSYRQVRAVDCGTLLSVAGEALSFHRVALAWQGWGYWSQVRSLTLWANRWGHSFIFCGCNHFWCMGGAIPYSGWRDCCERCFHLVGLRKLNPLHTETPAVAAPATPLICVTYSEEGALPIRVLRAGPSPRKFDRRITIFTSGEVQCHDVSRTIHVRHALFELLCVVS